MRSPSSHRDGRQMSVQMTPMIDVVFQLLIFFICTANFQRPEEVLPTHMLAQGALQTEQVVEPPLDEPEPIVVLLSRQAGRPVWNVGGRELTNLAEVRDVLQTLGGVEALRQRLPIVLDVSPDVPLGDVVDLYDLCRSVNFEKIQFAAHLDRYEL